MNAFASQTLKRFVTSATPAFIAVIINLSPWTPSNAELVDRIIAVVNDDIILQSEVEQQLSAIEATLIQQGYTLSQQREILAEQRKLLVSRMIDDKLTDQQVKRFNIDIDDQAVEETIARVREVNRLTDDELRRQLEISGVSYADYRQQIKERMLRARLLNREVKSKIVITDSEVAAYYEANREQYESSTKYELRHILLRVKASDGSMRRMQIQQQMEAIHERLENGENFENMASLYSNAATAAQGGRLGVFSKKSLTKQVLDALSGLKEKQFTQILATDQGYQIFYIEKIIQTGGKTLEEAKPEIQDKLYADIVDRQFQSWLEALRQKSHIQIME